MISPHRHSVMRMDEPPDEKKGSGTPVAGNTRATTAQFMMD